MNTNTHTQTRMINFIYITVSLAFLVSNTGSITTSHFNNKILHARTLGDILSHETKFIEEKMSLLATSKNQSTSLFYYPKLTHIYILHCHKKYFFTQNISS